MLFGEVVVQPDLGDVWGIANWTSDLELEVKGRPVPHHTHGPPLWHLEIPQGYISFSQNNFFGKKKL